jgi:hypothetical protein
VAGEAVLAVSEGDPGKERLRVVLKALAGTVAQGDFGNPVNSTTRYDVCVYNQADVLVADLTVDRGTQYCGTKLCWKPNNSPGYTYGDRSASSDGVKGITVKSGGPGLGRVTVRAANRAPAGQTSMPTGITAQLQAPNAGATVQVLSSDARCFEASLPTIRKNTPTQFNARKP